MKLQWGFGEIPKTLHGLMRAFVHHPGPRFSHNFWTNRYNQVTYVLRS